MYLGLNQQTNSNFIDNATRLVLPLENGQTVMFMIQTYQRTKNISMLYSNTQRIIYIEESWR